MDKLRAMATFVRIVESGSLTAAAERLDTSLTSVVRALSALEQSLGVRLLNRTTRRIALTDEGREYFERCRHLLAEVEEAEAALSARRVEPSGRLAVTAPVMFGRMHVGPVVTDFLAAYPQMRAELLLLDRVVDLLEEGIDVAIRIGSLPDSSLVAIPLGSTQRVVCASPDYLARCGTPGRPADLAGHRCIRFTGLSSGTEWEFGRGKRQRVTIADIFATNQIDAALDACAKGLGCGRFLAYQVHDLLTSGRLVRVLPDDELEPVPVSLAYAHSRLLSPRIRAFIDWAVPRLRERLIALDA
jgi:DNA-binding transcriptional LysR family regulator